MQAARMLVVSNAADLQNNGSVREHFILYKTWLNPALMKNKNLSMDDRLGIAKFQLNGNRSSEFLVSFTHLRDIVLELVEFLPWSGFSVKHLKSIFQGQDKRSGGSVRCNFLFGS